MCNYWTLAGPDQRRKRLEKRGAHRTPRRQATKEMLHNSNSTLNYVYDRGRRTTRVRLRLASVHTNGSLTRSLAIGDSFWKLRCFNVTKARRLTGPPENGRNASTFNNNIASAEVRRGEWIDRVQAQELSRSATPPAGLSLVLALASGTCQEQPPRMEAE